MAYEVLTDADIEARVPVPRAVEAITKALREHAAGTLIAPARFAVPGGPGSLVFTVGGSSGEDRIIGFRAYGTFPRDHPDASQVVALYDAGTGALRCVVIGNQLGRLRTAAIGAVALDRLARREARVLALIGSGNQARAQLEGALAVRKFAEVRVFSPTEEHREAFARDASARHGVSVDASKSARAAVEGADAVICATSAREPVIDADWVQAGAYVSTMGSKAKLAPEVDPRIAERAAVLCTDSRAQLAAYPEPGYILRSPNEAKLIELGALVAGKVRGRADDRDIALFSSNGLAGTEVFVAQAAWEAGRGAE